MGGYDNFEKIRAICDKHNVWMHIDGCWGGAVMMSKKWKGLIKGSEMSDSFSFNPHKMLGVPISTSFLMVNKHKGLL